MKLWATAHRSRGGSGRWVLCLGHIDASLVKESKETEFGPYFEKNLENNAALCRTELRWAKSRDPNRESLAI